MENNIFSHSDAIVTCLLAEAQDAYTQRLLKELFKNIGIIKEEFDSLKKEKEKIDKIVNFHCMGCVNKEDNICLGMNTPISVETLINCEDLTIYDYNATIETIKEVLKNEF